MIYEYALSTTNIKTPLLHEEIVTAGVNGFTGIRTMPGVALAVFLGEPTPEEIAALNAVLAAHDPAGTTAAEDAQIEREATKAALVAAQAEQILDRLSLGQTANATDDTATATDIANLASVSNLADAKVVLGRMLAREKRALAREAELMTTLAKLIQFISREFGSRS